MNILQVDNLKTYLYTKSGITKAVNDISFKIKDNTVFGLVGESGSGKTLTALSILRLIPRSGKIMGGSILFRGSDLPLDEDSMRAIRGARISIVFQEPSSALNPVFTVGYQIIESVIMHQRVDRRRAREIALEYLRMARIPEPVRVFNDYPHRLSGGTIQRAMIAMSLVNEPELVIMDEPTTALDVTVQAEILDLLEEIVRQKKLSILFISHDFGVISRICHEVGVMCSGKIVEMGSTHNILTSPREKYTISLIESVKALA